MTLRQLVSYAGLALFVLVLAVNLLVLVYDLYLLVTDQATISREVWAAPILAVALVGWQLVGALGLTAHLLVSPA